MNNKNIWPINTQNVLKYFSSLNINNVKFTELTEHKIDRLHNTKSTEKTIDRIRFRESSEICIRISKWVKRVISNVFYINQHLHSILRTVIAVKG